jgi:hypothetical protein
MPDVRVEDCVHFLARTLWGVEERQQHPNLIEGHVQVPAVSNE